VIGHVDVTVDVFALGVIVDDNEALGAEARADSSGRRNTEGGRRVQVRRRGSGFTEVQAEFVKLIEQGVSNSEACRILGIHRKTGTRWRLGRTIHNRVGEPVHYPPVASRSGPPPVRGIVKTCGSACHAACSSVAGSAGRSTSLPFSKRAPARTRATR